MTPCLFIGYSHLDASLKQRFVDALRVAEPMPLEIWDDNCIPEGVPWHAEIERAAGRAAVAVLLLTTNLLGSDYSISRELLRLLLPRARAGAVRIVLVWATACDWQAHAVVRDLQVIPRDGPVFDGSVREQERLRAVVDRIRELAAVARQFAVTPEPAAPVVDTTGFVTTGVRLFGRTAELAVLDLALHSHRTRIVCFEGPGGSGKSTLVGEWLKQLRDDPSRGVGRAFAWTLRSGGAGHAHVFAEEFVDAALRFFAEPGDVPPQFDRGAALARRVARGRHVVVLDGIEPVLSRLAAEHGAIQDPDLAAFLRVLASSGDGLCVVTTREPVADLAALAEATDFQRLQFLATQDGVMLLRAGGAGGTDTELAIVVTALRGHTLALSLLLSLMRIRTTSVVPELPVTPAAAASPDAVPGSVLAMIAAEIGPAEREVLRLLTLADRPLEGGALHALRHSAPLPGLTGTLSRLDDTGWRTLVAGLRQCEILAPAAAHDPEALDCHPIVRTFFAQNDAPAPAAVAAAHACLAAHYERATRDLPETREEMAPLYLAVVHGCRARAWKHALDDVFYRRVQRREQSFNVQYLGAYGADLTMCGGFFGDEWAPLEDLGLADQTYVQNCAGFDLMVLGRLTDAERCMLAARERSNARRHWREAAVATVNLVEAFVLRGCFRRAKEEALEGVKLAELSRDWQMISMAHAQLGRVLHCLGQPAEALRRFEHAETVFTAHNENSLVQLASFAGVYYCDLLLSLDRVVEVGRRAALAVEMDRGLGWDLEAAADLTVVGAAKLAGGDAAGALACAEEAIEGFARFHAVHHAPRALLLCAGARRALGDLEGGLADARRVADLAQPRGFRHFEILSHLEHVAAFAAMPDPTRARRHLALARDLAAGPTIPTVDQAIARWTAHMDGATGA